MLPLYCKCKPGLEFRLQLMVDPKGPKVHGTSSKLLLSMPGVLRLLIYEWTKYNKGRVTSKYNNNDNNN